MPSLKRWAAVCALAWLVSGTPWLGAQEKNEALGPAHRRIEELTGCRGSLSPKENVFKVCCSSATEARARGVRLTPGMGTAGWASFRLIGNTVQAAGAVTVPQEQVNPVLDAALAGGLEVTAIYAPFFYEQPRLVTLRFRGSGGTEKTASAFGAVFAKLWEPAPPRKTRRDRKIDPAKSTLDAAALDRILGLTGELKDGVYRVSAGRTTASGGRELGESMGVASRAAFAGSPRHAVVTGEYALLEPEIQRTVKALRASGITITALNNHMIHESPRIMFLQFWGTGPAEELARALRTALNIQKD